MQQLAVSFNFALLRESPQSIQKENTSCTPPCCNQCTQANNVKCFIAKLDKPCTRPAQCTNEKQQARVLTRIYARVLKLTAAVGTHCFTKNKVKQRTQRTLEGRERRRCLNQFTGFLECCSSGLTSGKSSQHLGIQQNLTAALQSGRPGRSPPLE